LAHEFGCIAIESNAPYSRDVISIPVYALSIKKLGEKMYKDLVYEKMEIEHGDKEKMGGNRNRYPK
jgi:hypothetical protein